MPDQRPLLTQKVLVLTVFLFVVPALLLAMFGVLVYPAIFEVLRNSNSQARAHHSSARSFQSPRTDAQVSDRDVALFREVVGVGVIPEPDVGDRRVGLPGKPVESTLGGAAPPVVSQTLRLCRSAGDDVACVPAAALYSIRVRGLAQAKEIDELTAANPVSLRIPAQRILTTPYDRVFRNARSWSDVWSFANQSNIPDCVQVTAPVYGEGTALVYVQRLWKGRGYGWVVRLKGVGDQWHVETRSQVWASHPSD